MDAEAILMLKKNTSPETPVPVEAKPTYTPAEKPLRFPETKSVVSCTGGVKLMNTLQSEGMEDESHRDSSI